MKLALSGFEPRYRPSVDAPVATRQPSTATGNRRISRAELLTNRAETRLFHAWRP